MYSRSPSLAGAALAALFLLPGQPASAQAPAGLPGELAQLAKGIRTFLAKQGEGSVAMGQFVGPPQLAANTGPGLARLLTVELEKLGVAVKVRSRLGLKGEFLDMTDKDSGRLAVQLKVRVVDRGGRALVELDCGILGNADVAALLGATADLPPGGGEKNRNDRLKAGVNRPRVQIAGSRASAAAGSPFAVEVLVGGKGRRPRDDDGMAFVDIRRGEAYRVRLVNGADHETAVLLAIDGINVFAFNEDPEPDGTIRRDFRVIVPPRSSVLVKGWYRSKGVANEFLVTDYARSAAAYLKSTAPTGIITASFHACWRKGSEPPADEPRVVGRATGFGEQVPQQFHTVARAFGVIRSIVSMRYSRE